MKLMGGEGAEAKGQAEPWGSETAVSGARMGWCRRAGRGYGTRVKKGQSGVRELDVDGFLGRGQRSDSFFQPKELFPTFPVV